GDTVALLEDGAQVMSATDSTLSGGAPGIMAYGNNGAVTDWSGGDITVASYSVGGTVTGLSGTLVLQDNGGDDLTITSDGSFTFDTAIDDGGTYGVTVQTQ